MARGISNALARVIRERAYFAGELAKADREVAAASTALKAAKAARRKIASKVAKLDAEIEESKLDPTEIRAIEKKPRVRVVQHGSFTAKLVELVRDAEGAITTGQIIAYMVSHLGLQYGTPAERDKTRRCIVERLRVLARKGAIKRLHETTDNQEGVWLWVGL